MNAVLFSKLTATARSRPGVMTVSDSESSGDEAINTDEVESFALPATEELLKKNALDCELSERSAIGTLGTTKSARQAARKSLHAASSITGVSHGNWGVLEASLEARKEVVAAPTPMAVAREWHSMPVLQMTAEMERDIRVIENRQHIDPKRFYKASGTGRKKGELPTKVQFGTVIEGPHEFYSSRINKRDRRSTFTEEVMADKRIMDYTKTRVRKIQKHATRQRRVVDPAAKRERRLKNRG